MQQMLFWVDALSKLQCFLTFGGDRPFEYMLDAMMGISIQWELGEVNCEILLSNVVRFLDFPNIPQIFITFIIREKITEEVTV